MALTIVNNVSSLMAQNHLQSATTGLNRSIERLSSGFRVNRGADDPAGLVISEKQRAQIVGLQRAIQNADKAVSLVQTAEGALSEINSLLLKVRGLSIDSANSGVNDSDALAANQAEIVNALETIDRIARNTQFGIKGLLDGSSGIQATATHADVIALRSTSETTGGVYNIVVTTPASKASVVSTSIQTAGLDDDEVLTINGVEIALNAGATLNDVVQRINSFHSQSKVTADVNSSGLIRLYTDGYGSGASLTVYSDLPAGTGQTGFGNAIPTAVGVNVAGTIGGTAFVGQGDVLTATSGPMKGVSLQFVADSANPLSTVTSTLGAVQVSDNSLFFQIGPNANQYARISIPKVFANSLGMGVNGNMFNNLSEINISTAVSAQDTIGIIDAAINEVTKLRGELGSFQGNTLESTANNLRITLENSVAADSTIRDTDFASEIATFTKQQILVQAGTSVLTSANQIPQQVINMLNAR